MPIRKAIAVWNGNLEDGNGRLKLGSNQTGFEYTFKSRFEKGEGTNPEELIGAASAGCFSMALAKLLDQIGYGVAQVSTDATVSLKKGDDGFAIDTIELFTRVKGSGVNAEKLNEIAERAKNNCPVSQALKGARISVKSELV